MKVELHFEGPYAWFPGDLPSVLEEDATTTKPGVYLWTTDTSEGDLVYYVGETGRSFRERFKEHLIEQSSGWYHIYDPDLFHKGRRKAIWPGLYEVRDDRLSRWEEYLRRLPELAPALAEYIRLMRFQLAPLDCDQRSRRRIEAGLAEHLYAQDGVVGDFQETGVRYWPTQGGDPALSVVVSTSIGIRGLPERLDLRP